MSSITIIDFTGIPGSGKSTLSKEIYKKLSNDYKCMNYKDLEQYAKKINKIKIKRYFMFFYNSLRYYRASFKFIKFFLSIKPYKNENLRFMRRTLEFYQLLILVSKENSFEDYDYLILDEGVLHGLWSTTLYGEISKNEHMKKLVRYIGNNLSIINVYSDIPSEEALKRISNRNTFISRLDKLNHEQVLRILNKNENTRNLLKEVTFAEEEILTISVNGLNGIEQKTEFVLANLPLRKN